MRNDGWTALAFVGAGLLLLLLGALIPARLRLLDSDILRVAGAGTPTLVETGMRAISEERVGPARLLLEAAQSAGLEGAAAGLSQVEEVLSQKPEVARWGGPPPWLSNHIRDLMPAPTGQPPAVLNWMLSESVRQALLRSLNASTHPATLALLRCRELEKPALFPPVASASGQPFDAALLLTASLVEANRMHPMLMLELERGAMGAFRDEGSMELEGALLELLAISRRLNWEQLATLLERTEDRESLQVLVSAAGAEGSQWGVLFSAIVLDGSARQLTRFIKDHGEAGVGDLRMALGLGTGAVQELLRKGHRVHAAKTRTWIMDKLGGDAFAQWMARVSGRAPVFALGAKYLLWLDGLFLLFAGLWYGRHFFLEETNRRFEPRPDLQRLIAVTAAAAVLIFLVSERLLILKSNGPGQGTSRVGPVFQARLRLDIPQARTPDMNEKIIAMLVAFFVIQLAIYFIGLGRLRYIRGKGVDGAVKLKLLDNEEAVFDAPLYVGIGGSVLALVMRLSGFDEVSLMASYSSTLFGILFCFVLKVMHVRPYRQRLILESAERNVV